MVNPSSWAFKFASRGVLLEKEVYKATLLALETRAWEEDKRGEEEEEPDR